MPRLLPLCLSALLLLPGAVACGRDFLFAGDNIENYAPVAIEGATKSGRPLKSEKSAEAVAQVVRELSPDILGVCEMGAKVQVLKTGLLFPARANRLFMLYSHYNSLDELPEAVRRQLEEKYFKKSLDAVWQETQGYFRAIGQAGEVEKGRVNAKHKMALVFRWYFGYSIRLAFSGDPENRVDYQVHTGPAMGAFNQWVKGTEWESWRARHVDQIAHKLMQEAAVTLEKRLHGLLQTEA